MHNGHSRMHVLVRKSLQLSVIKHAATDTAARSGATRTTSTLENFYCGAPPFTIGLLAAGPIAIV